MCALGSMNDNINTDIRKAIYLAVGAIELMDVSSKNKMKHRPGGSWHTPPINFVMSHHTPPHSMAAHATPSANVRPAPRAAADGAYSVSSIVHFPVVVSNSHMSFRVLGPERKSFPHHIQHRTSYITTFINYLKHGGWRGKHGLSFSWMREGFNRGG